MINFDFYRNNPAAAANLIAREGYCWSCPMCKKCDMAPNHSYYTCFAMWMRFFKFNSETLESVDDFSDLLSLMIDCDKCAINAIKKNNECDFNACVCGYTRDCRLKISNWLRKKVPTRQESRQAGLEDEDCEPAVSFNGKFLKKLAQAAKKMEPDKEYTLTEIERLLRDSENEAERKKDEL